MLWNNVEKKGGTLLPNKVVLERKERLQLLLSSFFPRRQRTRTGFRSHKLEDSGDSTLFVRQRRE